MNEKDFKCAVQAYLDDNNLAFDARMSSFPNIDCTLVCIGDEPVLIVTSNPQAGYIVEETENARMLLRSNVPVAV